MIDFILRPFKRRLGQDKEYFQLIDDMFGFIPHNIELYKLALIHKSASLVLEDGQQINNERLEFLGDSVIAAVTSDYVYIEFPDKNEGFMTQLRSRIVSRQTLNSIACSLGLDKHVIVHGGGVGFSQKHLYGDAFEALIGAVYLDQGYDFVNRLLINNIYRDHLSLEDLSVSETDFKSRLIEWCQKNHHSINFRTFQNNTNNEGGPVSRPSFASVVLIDGIEVGYGTGSSKKEAEQQAAFSVSQGVSEEACAQLLDRIDQFSGTNTPS